MSLGKIGLWGIVVLGGCWRADVYPVTREPIGDSGAVPDVGVAPDVGVVPDVGVSLDVGAGNDVGAKETLASPVCPSPILPAGDTNVTVQVGAVSRSYVLHVPQAYDGKKAVPLVVDFHGIGSSGWGEKLVSPYPAVTDSEGVIIAFPDGLKGPIGTGWNMGPCCVEEVDDFGFARALVTNVGKTACIDPKRVYAVGVLTGAGMVNALACEAADVFAAVAPAAFDLLQDTVATCRPVRPVSVVSFRGTADPRVPYAGGLSALVPGMSITFLGAEATFKKWAQINQCPGSPSNADSKGCRSYTGCQGDSEVVLCTKQGGGDDPGDATIAWPILKRHTL